MDVEGRSDRFRQDLMMRDVLLLIIIYVRKVRNKINTIQQYIQMHHN